MMLSKKEKGKQEYTDYNLKENAIKLNKYGFKTKMCTIKEGCLNIILERYHQKCDSYSL